MSGHTLLLNADYTLLGVNPLSTIDWMSAIKLEYTGAAVAVEYYDDWVVHSPSMELFVPAILRIAEYRKIRRGVKFSLRNLFLRDDHTCQYCGVQFLEIDLSKDHVTPRKFGGKTTWENIVTACKKCNHKRGHNIMIRPRREPYKPTVHELEAKLTCKPLTVHHPSWLTYLEGRWPNELLTKNYERS